MQLTKHWATQLDDYTIDLAWNPTGTQLAAASSAGPVSLFIATDGRRLHELPGHPAGTNCLAWAPSYGPQLILATGGQDGSVKFWDALAGQHTATANLGREWVDHLVWVPRGTGFPARDPSSALNAQLTALSSTPLLAAASGRNLTALRPDATVAHSFKPAAKTITALAAPHQGGCVAAAHFGGVQLWDTDDRHLAIGSEKGAVYVLKCEA